MPFITIEGLAGAAVVLLLVIYVELRAISKQLAVKIKWDHPDKFRDD